MGLRPPALACYNRCAMEAQPAPDFDAQAIALEPALDAPLLVAYARDITTTDLMAMINAPPERPAAFSQVIKRLNSTHHTIARLVSDGRSDMDIAAIMGSTPGRIRTLKDDPSFRELVTHYTQVKDVVYLDMHAKLAILGSNVVNLINDKVEDALDGGSKIALRDAKDIMEAVLDRIGIPAESVTTVHNGISRSEEISNQVHAIFQRRTKGVFIEAQVIDVTSVEEGPAAPPADSDTAI